MELAMLTALTCPFTSPCVIVSPAVREPAPPGTVQTFRGVGWKPRSPIDASFGTYCPPEGICAGVGLGLRFRTDSRGRFTFRLRAGTEPPPGPGPKAAGGEEVQFAGTTPRGSLVGRIAVPLPPPSTPVERVAGRKVASALLRLSRSIARRQPISARASDRQQAELERCRPLLTAAGKAGKRQRGVLTTLVDQTLDASTYGVDAAAFLAFADRLEALHLTPGRLADGAAAWIAAIRTPRTTPEPDLCTVLDRWSDAGFTTATEPAGPDVPGLNEQIWADPRIPTGGEALRDLGIPPREQRLFTGELLGLERYVDF